MDSLVLTDENKFRAEFPGVWDTAFTFLETYGLDTMFYKLEAAVCTPQKGEYQLTIVDIDTSTLAFVINMKRRGAQLLINSFKMLYDPDNDD